MENKIYDLIKNKKSAKTPEMNKVIDEPPKDEESNSEIDSVHEDIGPLKVIKKRINLEIEENFTVQASEDYLAYINGEMVYCIELDRWTGIEIKIDSLIKTEPDLAHNMEFAEIYALKHNYLVISVPYEPSKSIKEDLCCEHKDCFEHEDEDLFDFYFFIINKYQNKISLRNSFKVENARQVLLFPDHFIYVKETVNQRKYKKLKEQILLDEYVDEVFVIDEMVFFKIDERIYSTLSHISFFADGVYNINSDYLLMKSDVHYQILEKAQSYPKASHTYKNTTKILGNTLLLLQEKAISLIDLSTGTFKPIGSISIEPYWEISTVRTEDNEILIFLFDDDPKAPRTRIMTKDTIKSTESKKISTPVTDENLRDESENVKDGKSKPTEKAPADSPDVYPKNKITPCTSQTDLTKPTKTTPKKKKDKKVQADETSKQDDDLKTSKTKELNLKELNLKDLKDFKDSTKSQTISNLNSNTLPKNIDTQKPHEKPHEKLDNKLENKPDNPFVEKKAEVLCDKVPEKFKTEKLKTEKLSTSNKYIDESSPDTEHTNSQEEIVHNMPELTHSELKKPESSEEVKKPDEKKLVEDQKPEEKKSVEKKVSDKKVVETKLKEKANEKSEENKFKEKKLSDTKQGDFLRGISKDEKLSKDEKVSGKPPSASNSSMDNPVDSKKHIESKLPGQPDVHNKPLFVKSHTPKSPSDPAKSSLSNSVKNSTKNSTKSQELKSHANKKPSPETKMNFLKPSFNIGKPETPDSVNVQFNTKSCEKNFCEKSSKDLLNKPIHTPINNTPINTPMDKTFFDTYDEISKPKRTIKSGDFKTGGDFKTDNFNSQQLSFLLPSETVHNLLHAKSKELSTKELNTKELNTKEFNTNKELSTVENSPYDPLFTYKSGEKVCEKVQDRVNDRVSDKFQERVHQNNHKQNQNQRGNKQVFDLHPPHFLPQSNNNYNHQVMDGRVFERNSHFSNYSNSSSQNNNSQNTFSPQSYNSQNNTFNPQNNNNQIAETLSEIQRSIADLSVGLRDVTTQVSALSSLISTSTQNTQNNLTKTLSNELRKVFQNVLIPKIEVALTELALQSSDSLLSNNLSNNYNSSSRVRQLLRGGDVLSALRSFSSSGCTDSDLILLCDDRRTVETAKKLNTGEVLSLVDRISYFVCQSVSQCKSGLSSSQTKTNNINQSIGRLNLDLLVALLSYLDVHDFANNDVPVFHRCISRLEGFCEQSEGDNNYDYSNNNNYSNNVRLVDLLIKTQKHLFGKWIVRKYGEELQNE